MKKKRGKWLLSLILSLVMIVGLMSGIPSVAKADETSIPRLTSLTVPDGYLYDRNKVANATFACHADHVAIENYSEPVVADNNDTMLGVVRIYVDTPRTVESGIVTETETTFPTEGSLYIIKSTYSVEATDGTLYDRSVSAAWVADEGLYRSTTNGVRLQDDAGKYYYYYLEIIPMKESAENHTPVIKDGIAHSSTAEVVLGESWSLDLTSIFEDEDNDTLTYSVKIGDAEAVAAEANYSYTPAEAGTETLVFTANDGKEDSEAYTVTLTVNEAVVTIPRLTSLTVPDGYLYDRNKVANATFACHADHVEVENYSEPVVADNNDTMLGVVRIYVDTPRTVESGIVTETETTFPTEGSLYIIKSTYSVEATDGTLYDRSVSAAWVADEGLYRSTTNGVRLQDASGNYYYYYLEIIPVTAVIPRLTSLTLADGYLYDRNKVANATFACHADHVDVENYSEPVTADNNDCMLGVVQIYVDTPRTVESGTVTETETEFPDEGSLYIIKSTYSVEATDGTLFDRSVSAAWVAEENLYRSTTNGVRLQDGSGNYYYYYLEIIPSEEAPSDNHAPKIKAGLGTSATAESTVGEAWTLDLATIFEDADNDPLTYKVKVGDAEAVDADANYSYTPDAAGTVTLVFTASDGKATSQAYKVTLVVKSSDENHAPTIKAGIGTSVTAETTVGKAWTLDLTTIFEDADNDPLTYKVRVGDAEAVAADANYSYTPDAAGTMALVFTANDGKVDSLPYTVTLTVKPVQPENYAPAIKGSVTTNPTTESITVQKEWCINLFDVFEDVENDPLTFKYRINNDVFVDTDSSFRYIPDDIGTYTIEFKANDGHSDSEAYIVYLEVNDGTFILVLDNAPWGIARISINGEEVELIKNDLNSLRTTETVKAGSFVEVYYCPYKTSDDIKDLSYVSVSRYPDGALHQLGTVTGPFTGNFTMPEHDTKVWMYYDKDPEKPRFNIVGLPDPKFGIDTIPDDSDIAVVKIVNEDGNAVTQAEAGELLTITATSKDTEAYRFDHWECPVEGIVTDENRTLSSFSFVMPAESILPDNPIKAVFKAVGSDISIETNDVSAAQVLLSYLGGSIEAKENNIPVTTTVMSGKEVTAIVSNLNEAYKYDWLVTKSAEGVVTDITSDVVVNGQPKFTVDGTSNYSVKAIFTAKDYGNVIVNANDSKMGTATAQVGSDAASANLIGVNESSTVKLNASPLEGYLFKGWTASYGDPATAVEITDADKEDASFVMPATNHAAVNVVATFEKDPAFASHETVLEDVELTGGGKTYPADQDDTTFTITLPDDVDTADLASWKLAFTVSEGATVTKGDQTFSSGDACGMQLNTPATFVVTAEDKDTKQEYTVVINGKEAPTIEEIAEETGTGWFQVEEKWYYAENGKLQKGWKKPGSTWYYLDPETGEMQTGIQTINGAKYYLDPNGAMKTGWINDDGTWYFAKDSGALVTGWLQVGSTWYYLNTETCVMETGWVKVNGTWYYMKESGAMATGWVKDGDTWYYMNSSGAMVTGWVKVNNTWYFMKSSGAMAANEWVTGYYWIGASGAWTYQPVGSWKQNSTGWWFGDTSGWYAKNETVKINNVLYTFNAAGYWVE